jgi:hypothetical protein
MAGAPRPASRPAVVPGPGRAGGAVRSLSPPVPVLAMAETAPVPAASSASAPDVPTDVAADPAREFLERLLPQDTSVRKRAFSSLLRSVLTGARS